MQRDGVRVSFEVHGAGEPTILLLPTYSIIHSRMWKGQVPYLARHARVITFDGRGNGRSDRPVGAEAYAPQQFADDALAVMDAAGAPRVILVALSCGAMWATVLAADHPDRVDGVVYIAPAANLVPGHPERAVHPLDAELDTDEGWAKYNAPYWKRDYQGFLDFFFDQCLSEPHSSKPIEDCVAWASETTPETLADVTRGLGVPWHESLADSCARVRCPTLVIHGDDDHVRPLAQGAALADRTRGQLVTLHGSGHLPNARDPVKVNELIRAFACPRQPPARWTRAGVRTPRALFISSPIGLGHARRDLVIAAELRRLRPELEIEWLAQHPLTVMLQAHGERIHPLSDRLASESAHINASAHRHELRCFDAIRAMDEILLANFMVFLDAVRDESYDVWIGDEAWELDYHLHENPELKTAPYVWLSDFVGWLPMPEAGAREAWLTADSNAEMLEQRARFPRLRDRSIFIGEPEDIVAERFGPGLPLIRDWTEDQFAFSGYILTQPPLGADERAALRAQLGYHAGETVCIVSVGGSGIGTSLLERVATAAPTISRQVHGLRMIVVTGPRIDPASVPVPGGVEVRGHVPDLNRHLAACDIAVVQGGLATTMELAAAGRPFLYFPLAGHFEQRLHVAHRLDRYGTGRRMDFDSATPDELASAIVEELGRTPSQARVPPDAGARAAALIADLF